MTPMFPWKLVEGHQPLSISREALDGGVSANLLYRFEQFILQTVQSGSCGRPAKVTFRKNVNARAMALLRSVRHWQRYQWRTELLEGPLDANVARCGKGYQASQPPTFVEINFHRTDHLRHTRGGVVPYLRPCDW